MIRRYTLCQVDYFIASFLSDFDCHSNRSKSHPDNISLWKEDEDTILSLEFSKI
jgi:hypothetical protein